MKVMGNQQQVKINFGCGCTLLLRLKAEHKPSAGYSLPSAAREQLKDHQQKLLCQKL
jgi:hypothetical protein